MRPGSLRRALSRAGAPICVAAIAVLFAAVGPAGGHVYALGECVDIALENNISIASARVSLDSAETGVLSNWSGVLPHVSAGLSASDYLTVTDGDGMTSDGRTGSVSLSQTLFDGSTFAGISAAYHGRDASARSLEWTRRDVVFAVKQSYYGLLKAERLRDVQAEAVSLSREQLRKTQSLFDLGSASRSDLLKAQVQVDESELSLITAETSVKMARAGLCYTLGIDVTTDIEVVDPPQGEGGPELLEYDLGKAISRRPDVQASEESVIAATRSVLAAKAARWPDLDLSVSYSRTQDSFGDLFDDMKDDYWRSVNLSLSIPIFNGLATRASVASSKCALRSHELSLRDARLGAAYEIEMARLAVIEQRESVKVAERSVESARADLEICEERFRLRAASMLELIIVRVAYSRARAGLVEARYDYEIAKAELKLVLGL